MFSAPLRSELIGYTAKILGKEFRPVAVRKQLIEDGRARNLRDLTGPCSTHSTNRKTGHKRVQLVLAGGFSGRPEWY